MNTTVDNSARPIKTRRIKFRYPTGSLNRHYVQGDLVMSHIIAMLSAVFPEGEDYFIRSVKHYSDQITDPVLKKQVAGFIGQEVTHGREHRELNDRLQQMGYPTAFVDRMTKRGMNFYTLRFPPRFNLAVTAALEHYTATLAETLLTDQRAQDLLGDTEVRSILLWHALEESEHRAVAFDVYR
ncbi:metal-dependent hydrolase, partial [Mycobacteroides abscessus subsp. massiliense]